MEYVLGVDLGTSSVKILMMDQEGNVIDEATREYPLIQEKAGHSEQEPEDWVKGSYEAIKEITGRNPDKVADIKGLSYSGQMHGLVLLDENGEVLRNAILWNDTRTTQECRDIENALGADLLKISRNKALEGFTLPKILWVKKHEPEIFEKARVFLLPKDYVRYRMTGDLHMDYSDAAGTLLLDVAEKKWSEDFCKKLGIDIGICPELIESVGYTGDVTAEVCTLTGLGPNTKVIAGGADNACGATGAGILNSEKTLCSIGTSGVFLAYEENKDTDYQGAVHFFNHAKPDSYYSMGVTLAAGFSLSWFRDCFGKGIPFAEFLQNLKDVPIGSRGILYAPYIMGERTPYADAEIRGSFLGVSGSSTRDDFARSVLEGITFSLRDCMEIMKSHGTKIEKIVSIGGGAKNPVWLQMQADIFNATILTMTSEQGPAMGATMLAAVGSGLFGTLEECAERYISFEKEYKPVPENVERYNALYEIYQKVYESTKEISHELKEFR